MGKRWFGGASQRWSNRVVVAAAVFAGFGVAHLSDDILYGVPAEFHLSDPAAQLLGLVFFGALSGLIALAGRRRRASYQGLVVSGLVMAGTAYAALRRVGPPGR